MTPSQPSGRINYLEFPAQDAAHSARFYMSAFGWRRRGTNGSAPLLEDASGLNISFVSDRPPANDAGVLLYVLVENVVATCRAVEAHGAEIVQPVKAAAPDITARFRDPGGNIIEIYQQPPAKSRRDPVTERASPKFAGLVALVAFMLIPVALLILVLWIYG